MSMRPKPSPGQPGFVVLVCDWCGVGFGSPVHLRDWYVLWPVAVRAQWSGEPKPFGTHFCDGCASAAAADERPS